MRSHRGYTQPWGAQAATAEPWKHLHIPHVPLEHGQSLLGGSAELGRAGTAPCFSDPGSRTLGEAKAGFPTPSQGWHFYDNTSQQLGFWKEKHENHD